MTDPTSLARRGLSTAEVAERVAKGQVNDVPDAPSRTVAEIIQANTFTTFNALIGALFAVVMLCGAYRDGLFGGVIVANTVIGIVQELRAKRTLDNLAVISAPKVSALRNGETVSLAMTDLVLDDVVDLLPGQQLVADSVVLEAENLEVDESLLTGEGDPVVKAPGDPLLSGSFVVAGNGRAQVTKVGADAYAAQLAEEARRFSLVHSELRTAIDRIVRLVGYAVVPTGIALFISQLVQSHHGIRTGLVLAVGGVVAMVPEGLVLLTSVAFMVGVVRLARKRTLVQELPAIEVLARVDVICLDKTGTITSGMMEVADVVALPGTDSGVAVPGIDDALASLAWVDPHPNATQAALQRHVGTAAPWKAAHQVAFSSARKWSAASFEGHGTWVFGAPEMVASGSALADIEETVGVAADAGRRVLLLAYTDAQLTDDQLPNDLVPAALVMLEDQIRTDAADTLAYFVEQGVAMKVISGDSPRTVGAVARRVGLAGADTPVDARTLPTDQNELADVMERSTVFGRVSPHQKREMVKALQSRGHVVAMTGDGVNDVLALKDSDCGIAMASGSEATRAVAQLVLLDSTFSSLPAVLAEGRRVINNVERVASLFLVKTVYAMFFAIATIVTNVAYPFLPRHLTLVSTFTIGLPAFLLAFAPNNARVRTGFLGRVLRVALPGAVVASVGTFTAYLIARSTAGVSQAQAQTVATLVLASSAVLVLARVARPLQPWKVVLIASMAGFLALCTVVPALRDGFALVDPPGSTMLMAVSVIALTAALLPFVWSLGERVVRTGERRLSPKG